MKTTRDQPPEPLLLASASPRRIETLQKLGFNLVVVPALVDESVHDDLPVRRRVIALAELKARTSSASAPFPPLWAIGADTLVSLDDVAFGKPADESDARSMLAALSGKTHTVSSGICVLDRRSGELHSAISETHVHFATLSDEEVDAYVATGEWQGAAGAYRIQERAAFFVEWLEGSFSGVVGLPLHEFYAILCRIDFPFPLGKRADATSWPPAVASNLPLH
jgi:septum formation protein